MIMVDDRKVRRNPLTTLRRTPGCAKLRVP